jgi:hypothetical protein
MCRVIADSPACADWGGKYDSSCIYCLKDSLKVALTSDFFD